MKRGIQLGPGCPESTEHTDAGKLIGGVDL